MFDCLADFIKTVGKEDKQFAAFLIIWATTKMLVTCLLLLQMWTVLEEVNEWLQYFLQARLHAKGGNIYTSLLIGLSSPFSILLRNSVHGVPRRKGLAFGNYLYSQKIHSIGVAVLSWQIWWTLQLLKVFQKASRICCVPMVEDDKYGNTGSSHWKTKCFLCISMWTNWMPWWPNCCLWPCIKVGQVSTTCFHCMTECGWFCRWTWCSTAKGGKMSTSYVLARTCGQKLVYWNMGNRALR